MVIVFPNLYKPSTLKTCHYFAFYHLLKGKKEHVLQNVRGFGPWLNKRNLLGFSTGALWQQLKRNDRPLKVNSKSPHRLPLSSSLETVKNQVISN